MSSNGGTFNFQNIRPPVFEQYVPRTTGQAVISKKVVEFLPDTQQDLQYSKGARVLRFNIADTAAIMCGSESYLEWTLEVDTTSSKFFTATTLRKALPMLETGGCHAFIDKIEVKSNMTGNIIQMQEYYNKWYTLQTRTLLGDNDVAQVFAGDGILKGTGLHIMDTSKISSANTQLAINGAALEGVRDSDQKEYNNSSWLDPDSPFVLQPVINENNVQSLGLVKTVFRLKLLMSFLQQNIPLMLMKNGIQIIITLAPEAQWVNVNSLALCGVGAADYVSNAGAGFADINSTIGANAFAFKIKNPRYVCMLILPNEQYSAELAAKYRTDNGILLNIPSTRVFRFKQQDGVKQLYTIQPGVRSMSRVIVGTYNVVQLDAIETVFAYFNHSHIPINWWRKYQFRIGAIDYPNRLVDGAAEVMDPRSCMIAHFHELCQAFQVTNCQWRRYAFRTRLPYRATATEFHEDELPWLTNADLVVNNSATRRVWIPSMPIAVDFRRDNSLIGSELNGQDVSVTPLEFRGEWISIVPLNAAAAPNAAIAGNWHHLFFVEHDAWYKISAKTATLLN